MRATTIYSLVIMAAVALAVGGAAALGVNYGKKQALVVPDTEFIERVCAAKGMTVQRSDDDVNGQTDGQDAYTQYESTTVCEDAQGNGLAVQLLVMTKTPLHDEDTVPSNYQLTSYRVKASL